MHRWLACLPLLALAVLPSCGGCGCSDPVVTPTPQTLTLPSEADRDGWASTGNFVADAPSGDTALTGDTVTGTQARRQFFSFDLSTLPASATIQSATLRLFQEGVTGTPYTTHGVVVVDHLVYDLLDASDYDAAPLTANVGNLSTAVALEYKTLNVTTQVQADVAGTHTRSQFRVRWSLQDNDGDPTDDFARFVDAEDLGASGNPPQLVIVYTVP
jgi:hypothetical protein